MAATSWLVRRRLFRRWTAMVPLALVVGFGGAGAMVALGAADRTAHAYDHYLERADVGDLVVNPSLNTADFDRVVRRLPGVESVTSDALLVATVDLGDLSTDEAGSGFYHVQVRGSVDGRYLAMDRPSLAEGRHPTGTREALVNVDLARDSGIDVGDVLPVSFGYTGETMDIPGPSSGEEQLTVVGIAALPGEVLPDPLYPRYHVVVSPDVARRYDCVPEVPEADATLDQVVAIVFPEGCAVSFRYYSLALDDGHQGVAAALDTVQRATVELTAELPQAALDEGAAYFLVATTPAQEAERVARSLRPTVAALGALGLAAAAVTLVVAGVAAARDLRRAETEQARWWQLGMGAGARTTVLVVPLAVAVAAGLGVAIALSWWLSPIGPVGNVRAVDPSPGRTLSGWTILGAVGLAALLALMMLWLAAASARRAGRPLRREVAAFRPRVAAIGGRPEITEGVRAAYGGRGSGLVVAGAVVAAIALLTVVVFAASLSALISTPAAYGWTWDLAVISNVGYGPIDLDAVEDTLDGHDQVAGWTALSFANSIGLDGELMLSMVRADGDADDDVTVIEGEVPSGDDEVALGLRTAVERGIEVGDEVEVGDAVESRRMTVSGLVVFPALGPYLSDRATPGTGLLLPAGPFEDEDGLLVDMGFIGIDLVDGADPQVVRAALGDDVSRWDLSGDGLLEYDAPIRPPEIDDARSIRTLPAVVGGLVVLAATIGLSFAVVVSVRSRRRELAILRAIGFTDRQVRGSVRVQAIATMVAALGVGVPLGVVAGRVAWRGFASQLGVVPEPSTPLLWLLVTVAGGLVVALVAAAVPARMAARSSPAAGLRSE